MLNPSLLEESLAVLGESLAERGLAFEIVAVGGGSLLLLGLISRPGFRRELLKALAVLGVEDADGHL
jgi:hypothetical protein